MPDHPHITDEELEREFADLLTEVRAERPEIDPAFAAALDERLAAPESRSARRRFAGWRPSPALMGGFATAAAAIAVAVPVALETAGDDASAPGRDTTTATTLAAPSAAADAQRQTESAAGATPLGADAARGAVTEPLPPGTTLPVPPIDGGVAPGVRDRKVERSASVTLAAPADKIEEVADEVIRVTDEAGGIVITSNVTSEGDAGRASFDLRVPTAKLRMFLREVSEIDDATVRARSQGSVDVTRASIDAGERLADARAERKTLLRLLARADTANETASIRARLRITAAEIAAARAEVRAIGERTSLSTVSVSIVAEEPEENAGSDGASDALVVAAIVPSALLLGLLAYLAIARRARRRREAALDAGD